MRSSVLCLCLACGFVCSLNAAEEAVLMDAQDFARKRAELLSRQRRILWDDDGCDVTHYPLTRPDLQRMPVTEENLRKVFLAATENTKVDVVAYCPGSSFGAFNGACRTRAALFTNHIAGVGSPLRNVAAELAKDGLDGLGVATRYCREKGIEPWVCLRMNDNHDCYEREMLSQFKLDNPDCLVGTNEHDKVQWWATVDYAKPKVRHFIKGCVVDFCLKYDIDGILCDFFRHPQFFGSVARGGQATASDCAVMTSLVRDFGRILERAGRQRGKPLVLAVRVPDSPDYCRAIGLDVEEWMRTHLIDIVVVGGYFRFNEWATSVELAHKYGVKCIASFDESRVHCDRRAKFIPGRNRDDNCFARYAAAFEQGCDGVFWFNFEYADKAYQKRVLSATTDSIALHDKLYFATDVGGGGYMPWTFLSTGRSYRLQNVVNPVFPPTVDAGGVLEFGLSIGDDPVQWKAKSLRPTVEATLLTNASAAENLSEFAINGRGFLVSEFKGGKFVFRLSADAIRRGFNKVSLKTTAKVRVDDFAIAIKGLN